MNTPTDQESSPLFTIDCKYSGVMPHRDSTGGNPYRIALYIGHSDREQRVHHLVDNEGFHHFTLTTEKPLSFNYLRDAVVGYYDPVTNAFSLKREFMESDFSEQTPVTLNYHVRGGISDVECEAPGQGRDSNGRYPGWKEKSKYSRKKGKRKRRARRY
jgi:hypothetical protein